MKRLGGLRETGIQLNAVSLDLRSPAGKTSEGYFRLVVNAISDREGRLRRLGGWKPLSLAGSPVGNEDLHDQLLTNTVSPTVVVSTSTFYHTDWGVSVMSPGSAVAPTATIGIDGGTVYAYSPILSTLPTVSVVPPETRAFVPWVGYLWRVTARTTDDVTTSSPGYIDLQYNSIQAGGTQTVRMYSNVNAAANQNVFAYGCAPSDAVSFIDTGVSDKLMVWNPTVQDSSLLPPTNTQVSCT